MIENVKFDHKHNSVMNICRIILATFLDYVTPEDEHVWSKHVAIII